MTNYIKGTTAPATRKAPSQSLPSSDDKAEAQSYPSYIRGESPIDHYYRIQQWKIDQGIGVPHYV